MFGTIKKSAGKGKGSGSLYSRRPRLCTGRRGPAPSPAKPVNRKGLQPAWFFSLTPPRRYRKTRYCPGAAILCFCQNGVPATNLALWGGFDSPAEARKAVIGKGDPEELRKVVFTA